MERKWVGKYRASVFTITSKILNLTNRLFSANFECILRTIKKNIYWILALLMLLVLAKHVSILHYVIGLDWELAITDGLISTFILTMSILGILLLVRAYPTTAAITLYALFVALFIRALGCLAQYESIKWWVDSPLREDYLVWLSRTLPVRFLIVWIFCTWVATIAAFRKNVAALDSRFQQQADASILLKEAELFKLRQQLQPHFLYNSLNSISALISISPDKAQEMVGKLSDFLRSSVKRESNDTLPIDEELNYIQSYLAIESVRFGDRLEIDYRHDYTDDAMIPPFLLQPILENAIKFGLYGNTGKVIIGLHISLVGDMLTLSVTNPYDPDMQPPRGTGFGLTGVQRRLYLIYSRSDLLETKKEGKQFTTILKIPQQYVQSNTD
jgi:two-component system, LytTR family, sensor kinase